MGCCLLDRSNNNHDFVYLKTFIDDLTVELFDKCRKDYLLAIASHFQIPIAKKEMFWKNSGCVRFRLCVSWCESRF